MPTVHTENIVVGVIRNNGQYRDDPVIQRITAYISVNDGRLCFGIEYKESIPSEYAPSPYVLSPIVIFDRNNDTEVAWLKDVNDFFRSNPGESIKMAVKAANDVGYAPLSMLLGDLKHRVHCLVLRGERWISTTMKV